MPSVSKVQSKYMRLCKHNPQHAKGKCPDMTDEQFSHFTRKPTKGLPNRKKRPVRYGK